MIKHFTCMSIHHNIFKKIQNQLINYPGPRVPRVLPGAANQLPSARVPIALYLKAAINYPVLARVP